MAIFHMNVQVISRADGRSVVAASAYRAGEKLRDERLAKYFDYRRKSEVSFRAIYGPKSAPDWMGDRERLWNEVERTEKRKDAQLAREIEVALPKELTHRKQIALLKEFLSHYFVGKGMVVDVALHDKGNGNPHAHILATMREVVGDGFGKKRREWNSTEYLESIRLGWAACVNHHLRRAGWRSTIDHLSLVEQGIARPATVHEGPKRHAMRRKGIANEAATHNKKIEEEIQMNKDNKPCLAPKRAPKPLLEVYENAVFWIDDSYERKHAVSQLFDREYNARVAELLPSEKYPTTEGTQEGNFYRRFELADGAVRDYGNLIKCERGSADEITVCIKLLKAKGCKSFAVHGPLPFRREMFLAAVIEGFAPDKIQGYQPTRDEVEALMAMKPRLFPEPVELVLVPPVQGREQGSGAAQSSALKPVGRKPR